MTFHLYFFIGNTGEHGRHSGKAVLVFFFCVLLGIQTVLFH